MFTGLAGATKPTEHEVIKASVPVGRLIGIRNYIISRQNLGFFLVLSFETSQVSILAQDIGLNLYLSAIKGVRGPKI
ncbi:MAG: hypothetical protein LBV23_10475 [Deltaproteobacteria bacterium]|jgi:hypothetical protein|nr:hypothetical protein [Deltaproteobacteria bacterium]